MDLFNSQLHDGLDLFNKLDAKFTGAFDKYSDSQKAAAALYFLPHKSSKKVLSVSRPRIVKWYCPFAHQCDFPSGHRYCINIYTGCSYKCVYCYAQGYEPLEAKCKDNYKKKLSRDLSELAEYRVPPAPLHISNSTDPCQPIEKSEKSTLYTLEKICNYRKYFTTITILTKNPSILAEPEYLKVLKKVATFPTDHAFKDKFEQQNLPALRIEVSLAFAQEQDVLFFDPNAPSTESRKYGIKVLRDNGIPVALRVDPLLPRDPLPEGKLLNDFHLPNAQSLENLNSLIKFAKDANCFKIVYSVAKITQPRNRPMNTAMQQLKQVYEYICQNERPVFKGNSFRLPEQIAQEYIVAPFLQLCQKHDIKADFCKQNLITTP